MRRLIGLLVLPALGLPALADEPPKPEMHHARLTWQQHFAQANLAHDGHLTLEEAKGGYPIIAKHFDDIDMDHKGYVTENDLRAWRIMRKAATRLTHPPEGGLIPRPAMQLGPVPSRPVNASASQTVNTPADPPPRETADKD